MKRKLPAAAVLSVAAAVCIIASCSQQPQAPEIDENNPDQKFTEAQIAHGQYLVTIMGCNDCHTPLKMGANGPEPDMEHMLSGHPAAFPMPVPDTGALKNWVLFTHTNTAVAGPWGISFSANLTSDETGIGNWNLAQFKKALKEGKYKGLDNSRTLLPPMPWRNYANIKDEDIRDIFAFLKSTKPVNNVVPAAVPPGGA